MKGFRVRGQNVKKKVGVMFSFLILSLLPNLVLADCAELSYFTSWVLEDEHRIIFYMGRNPLALVTLPYCDIHPTSTIRLLRSYVCDSDSIVVDGEVCSIMTVKVMY